jgi:hypothetical protein
MTHPTRLLSVLALGAAVSACELPNEPAFDGGAGGATSEPDSGVGGSDSPGGAEPAPDMGTGGTTTEPGLTSGLPADKVFATLSIEELTTYCGWQQMLPNIGSEIECPDGSVTQIGDASVEACVLNGVFPMECMMTVGQFEACLVALSDDPCAAEYPAECEPLLVCFPPPPPFACMDGAEIDAGWVCDGEADCANGEDEAMCFTCADSSVIPTEWVCDTEADCAGGEDEQSCPDDGMSTP